MKRWTSILRDRNEQSRWPYLILLSLAMACTLPLWCIDFLPTQDGPSHLYNVHVLRQLLNHSGGESLHNAFRLNFAIVPNVTGTAILLLLATLFPLLIAEKILVSMAILLLPLAMLYVIRAFDRRQWTFALVGLLFACHNLLLMGFYNFALSIGVAFFALGFWLRHRLSLSWRTAAIFVGLSLLTYLTHFASFAFLLVAIGCVTIQDLLLAVTAPRHDPHKAGIVWRRMAMGALALAPAYGLGLFYVITHAGSEAIYIKADLLWRIFLEYGTLVTYEATQVWIVHAFQVIAIAAASFTIIDRIRHRQWRSQRDSMLWLAAFLLIAFFRFPWWQSNGGWINNRLFLFAVLTLACWYAPKRRAAHAVLASGLLLAIAIRMTLLTHAWIALQPELREFAHAASYVKPHATVSYDLDNAAYSIGLKNHATNIGPFRHAACYCALGDDIVYADNYEANFSYFPVRWKSDYTKPTPDYIVVRHATREPPPEHLGNYHRIYTGPTISLLAKAPVNTSK